MSAPDALATSMLIILGIAFGVLFTLLFCLAKNAGKKDELEEFFENETPPPKKKKNEPESESKQPWEKDADWWKE